ncbi:MAG: hypothetical protein M1343_08235 [Chloroflexi bacterium]|nr:hypothetical protein [Chloroflexota bacterium]
MNDLTFRQLQQEQRAWIQYNFPGRHDFQPLLGVVEELGELAEATDDPRLLELTKKLGKLAHSHLKRVQGIRGTAEEHHAKAKDAIGDIVVFLSDYCSACGYDFQEIIETTWAEVKQRDWQKDKLRGGSESVPCWSEAKC